MCICACTCVRMRVEVCVHASHVQVRVHVCVHVQVCAHVIRRAKKASSIQCGLEKVELVQECFPKHFRVGAARIKADKETEKDDKQIRVKMERINVGTK